ncbi:MAG: 30S ribosomal protein S1 [Armatimonadota bacterium]
MDTPDYPTGAEQTDETAEQATGPEGGEQAPTSASQAEMEGQIAPLTPGQIVEGLIVHIDERGALVDVGTKSEGHISREDLADGTTEDGKPLEVGDRISVYVVRPEDDDGNPVLSKKRADYERVWQRVIEAHEKGEVLSAMVVDRVKGGLVVDLGLRGFLPASHVRTRNVHALDRFIGQSLKVKIVEVDRARKRVVVSHKNAVEEERQKRREKTLETLEENKVYRGVVRRITDYGAFVDLGGVDGLLHVTEMSWTRVNHPREVVQVGDRIDVMVLRYDREQNRISLGLKQILPDPWEEVPKNYKVGQVVVGAVTRVVPFGAFVKLEGTGIEGIIPNAELPGDRGKKAADVLGAGAKVEVKIVNIRPSERRMTLSLRQFEQAKERQQLKEFMQRQESSSRVTIGDLFGSVLADAHAAASGEGPRGRAAEESAEQQEPPVPAEEAGDSSTGLAAGAAAEAPDVTDTEEDSASLESGTYSSSESPAESEAERD